jgi:hypothetical protein
MSTATQVHVISPPETPLISLANFGRGIGRTPVTLWRWQKIGWLDASINIAGKPFLTREAVERFNMRARAGEFAKAPHAPRRQKEAA